MSSPAAPGKDSRVAGHLSIKGSPSPSRDAQDLPGWLRPPQGLVHKGYVELKYGSSVALGSTQGTRVAQSTHSPEPGDLQ